MSGRASCPPPKITTGTGGNTASASTCSRPPAVSYTTVADSPVRQHSAASARNAANRPDRPAGSSTTDPSAPTANRVPDDTSRSPSTANTCSTAARRRSTRHCRTNASVAAAGDAGVSRSISTSIDPFAPQREPPGGVLARPVVAGVVADDGRRPVGGQQPPAAGHVRLEATRRTPCRCGGPAASTSIRAPPAGGRLEPSTRTTVASVAASATGSRSAAVRMSSRSRIGGAIVARPPTGPE